VSSSIKAALDEYGEPYPLLRDDLRITRIGEDRYLVSDPRSDVRFEIGEREKLLLDQMDGGHSADQILGRYEERFRSRFESRLLREFIEQLRDNGLLVGSEQNIPERTSAGTAERSDSFLNTFFDVLVLLFGFVLHWSALLPVALGSIVAFAGVYRHWNAAYDEWLRLFRTVDVPLLLIVIGQKLLFLDVPKCLLQGMASRRFGGQVKKLGLELYRGLLPMIRCDIGDSLTTVSERGQRTLLTVRIAGQLAIATLAALGWLMTFRSGGLSHFFLLLAAPAVVGLLLQLNVFLPLDGQYALAWYWQTPKLWERARQETRSWLLWRRSREALSRRERFWFRFYGLFTYLWTWSLTVAIITLGLWIFTSRFGRAGAVFAMVLVLRWFQRDMAQLVTSWKPIKWFVRAGGKWYVRWPLRLGVLIALFLLANLPYAHEIAGECRVVPSQQYGARAQVTAEIVGIHVKEGDIVEAGDLIATLTDRDVGADLARTRAELEQARANYELLQNGPLPEDIAVIEREVDRLRINHEFQKTEVERVRKLVENQIKSQVELDQQTRLRDAAEQSLESEKQALARKRIGARDEEKAASLANIQRLEAQLDFHLEQQGLLELRTPIAGRVVTPFMSERLGQVAQEGELICVVESRELLVMVEADEAAATRVQPGMTAELRLWGLDGIPLHGRVERLAHSARDERNVHDTAVRSDHELLLQRPVEAPDWAAFRVYVKLDDAPTGLVSGMTGYSKIEVGTETLWRAMSRPVVRFFRTEVWSWIP
jgi:putative peptide zinc metalloprotease protein